METIERIKKRFKMQPHPEGGFYSGAYRSQEFIRKDSLPERYDSPRNLYSAIYFMVTAKHASKFHRLKTDEIWHFYKGDPIELQLISESGQHTTVTLTNEEGKERFQYLVKKNVWMAACCKTDEHHYSLAACTLAPGFEYKDFELAKRNELIKLYPSLEEVITKFT